MKKLSSKLKILTIGFVLASCSTTGIVFDPDAHFFFKDSQEEIYIMGESGERIYHFEQWQEFALMHKDKWKELVELLKKSQVEREVKKNYSWLPYEEQVKIIENVYLELSDVMRIHRSLQDNIESN